MLYAHSTSHCYIGNPERPYESLWHSEYNPFKSSSPCIMKNSQCAVTNQNTAIVINFISILGSEDNADRRGTLGEGGYMYRVSKQQDELKRPVN